MPEPEQTPGERMSLYWSTLRRRWWVAVVVVVLATVAGLLAASASPRDYDATAKVLVGQQDKVDALLGTSSLAPDPDRESNTNVELVKLDPVAADVAHKLRLSLGSEALLARVSATVDNNSDLVSITASDEDRGR